MLTINREILLNTLAESSTAEKIPITEEEYQWRKAAAESTIDDLFSKLVSILKSESQELSKVTNDILGINSKKTRLSGAKFLAKVAKNANYGEIYQILVKLHAIVTIMDRFLKPEPKGEYINYEEPDYNLGYYPTE